MEQSLLTATLFDIQGFSVHDGPGCRTLIFFKGCPLSCKWCSNPEGKNPFPEPFYRSSKCIMDGLCEQACPIHAITIRDGRLSIDRKKCVFCTSFSCAEACCTGGLQRGGFIITLPELTAIIQRDRQYWGADGGITLSGGEPFYQPEFVQALLRSCHESYIHTAVETCGYVPWSHFKPALPYLDWIFFDLKHLDPDTHKSGTGRSNRLILDNARRLAAEFDGRMIFRMVVVPGFNDREDHLQEVITFILDTGRKEINILPIHHLGREKYHLVGKSYYTSEFTRPAEEQMHQIRRQFQQVGINGYLGDETPF